MTRHLFLAATLCSAAALAEDAPVSLTASDGTGLKLVEYTARAVVADPLAFTELTLVFENPQDRVIEGQFRVTLPQGATLSRFAMKLDGRWQEGELVEKQAARRAYEDFLHRRQDPALLEQAAGNEFSARVFPIPARGKKELVVSWSHSLNAGDAPYVLPLKGLPEVAKLDVEVRSGGVSLAKLAKSRFVPDKDVSVQPPRGGSAGLRSGPYVVTRVKAVAASKPQPPGSMLLLVDSSASRALGYSSQLSLVKNLVERLAAANPALPLTVAAFDQSVQLVHDGPASGFGAAQLKALKDRRALGASDASKALAWALERGKKTPRDRVVLVSDGVFTAGDVEGDQLLAAVARLRDVGVQRLDAVAVGGIRDEAMLKRLATARLPSAGAVFDGDADVGVLVRRLSEATVAKVPVAAAGAKLVWPEVLEGAQAGDEAVVVIELPSADATPSLTVGGVAVDLSKGFAAAERPLLERAWAQARIEALLDRQDRVADGPGQKQQIREEIIALSVKHRVLSPYTALLVLETEADYARFHIDRKALADILTVQDGRLTLMHRGPETLAVAMNQPPAPSASMKGQGAKKMMKADRLDDSVAEKPSSGAPAATRPAEPELEAKEAASPEPRAASDEALSIGGAAPSVASESSMGMAAPSAPAPRPSQAPAMPPPPSRQRSQRRNAPEPSGFVSREERLGLVGDAANDNLPPSKEPYEGKFKQVMDALRAKQAQKALEVALGWREEALGDVLALVALGEACEASGDLDRAARAYGSLIDLFPARADLRRFAGGRLERLKDNVGLALAADDFAKAAEQRPDHPASHRMLAFALLRLGQPAKAFEAISKGLAQTYPSGRFLGAEQILREDAGLIAAAWMKAAPGAAPEVRERLAKVGGVAEDEPSLRFVLTWETDANDVDFHIFDGRKGHAFYSRKHLASGGDLYADVTTGYGPECFTIRLPKARRAYPYTLKAHYYSRGPMGYGMGKLELIEHDGAGGLRFEERPFVVMVDQAFVDLGAVTR